MVRGAENKTNLKFHTGDRTDQAHSQLAECWPRSNIKGCKADTQSHLLDHVRSSVALIIVAVCTANRVR